jgi:hypothetical protein
MSNTTQPVPGSVASLYRYPVKSMMGEKLNASEVTPRGLLGHRAYALKDGDDGKIASAKNPRKWPQLFDFRAVFVDGPRTGARVPPVRITLPDGAAEYGSSDGHSEWPAWVSKKKGAIKIDGVRTSPTLIALDAHR